MKRESLITKLVAFMLCVMMVVGCLPVGVFAEEATTSQDWEGDIDVVETTPPQGSEANPFDLTVDLLNEGDFSATVTVPAGETYYYIAYRVGGMIMSINGGEGVECTTDGMMYPYAWSITNDGEADAEYVITVGYPLGNSMNPEALVLGYNDLSLEAGDNDGYYYTWTATADGDLTFEISSITEGVEADIVIDNKTSYAQKRLAADGVENDFGAIVVTMPVAAGDEVSIQVVVLPDESYNYPAADITHYSEFNYPLGSEQNPILLLEQENTVTNAGTLYYQGYFSGMNMTVSGEGNFSVIYNGETIAAVDGVVSMPVSSANPRMPIAFAIVGDGEYAVNFTYPVGNMENPNVAVLGDNLASIEAGNTQGYFWTYTAEKAGDLVFTFSSSDGNWTYAINNMTTYAYGDTQWSDSETVVNPANITVAEGDVLQIMVNTYDPANMWSNPAGTVTFNLAYAPEGPIVDESLVFYRSNTSGGDLMLGDDIRASFMIKAPSGYDRIYLEVTKDGVTSIVEKNELSNATYFRYAYVVPAAHMTMDIDVTIWGEKEGVTYRGEELVFSIRRCAEAKLGLWIDNEAAAGQCKLIMNMLYYGEKAQLQFGVNTENLATAGLDQKYLDLITTELPTLKSYPAVDETGMTAKIYNMGFMLQEKVKLTVIFKLDTAVSNAEEYYIEVKHIPSKEGVDPVTYTYTSDDFELLSGNKMIRFFFDKIAPSQMRDDVEYTVYHNGEAISATYVRSMETVAQYYATNTPALTDLINAIMNYADAAKAVFG